MEIFTSREISEGPEGVTNVSFLKFWSNYDPARKLFIPPFIAKRGKNCRICRAYKRWKFHVKFSQAKSL